MKKSVFKNILIMATCLFANNLWADKDKFPIAPGMELVAVAEQMNYEGMTMRIRKFDVEMSVEEVLNFYRDAWKDVFVENHMPPWQMISSKQGDRFYTVQVQPAAAAGQSWGYLGTSDLPRLLEKGRQLGTNKKFFPMMNGSQIVNDLDNDDIGKKARTLWINNRFSVSSNVEYYRKFYTEQGWTKAVDQAADTNKSHVLIFQRGDKTVNLAIDASDLGTNIVVNDVKGGLF